MYPQGGPHLWNKFSKSFHQKSMSEKWKIHEKVVKQEIFAIFRVFSFQNFVNISCYDAVFSKSLKTRESWDQDGRFEYHEPYELWKVGDDFFMDFSFFAHRFFVKNLWKFILQMGNPLGVYETNYKVKKVQNLSLGKIWPPSDLFFLEWSYCS